MSFDEDQQSVTLKCNWKHIHDVAHSWDIDFGKMTYEPTTMPAPSPTTSCSEEPTLAMSSKVSATGKPKHTSTVMGFPAVRPGPNFDQRLDNKLGYYSKENIAANEVLSKASGISLEDLHKRGLFDFIGTLVGNVKNAVTDFVVNAISAIGTVLSFAAAAVKAVANVAFAVIQIAATGMYSAMFSIGANLKAPVNSISPFGSPAYNTLLDWFITTRAAAVTNPLDKVYGVLGLCSSSIEPDYIGTKDDLFYQVTTDAINEALELVVQRQQIDIDLSVVQHRLTRILDAVDHDPELSNMPSWVVDWSLPRRTVSLAHATSTLALYKAGGTTRDTKIFKLDDKGHQLHAKAAFFDTVTDLSAIFTDAELTYREPSQHNASLKEAITFVNERALQDTDSLFNTFCATLVAGKDRSGHNKFPQEYIEILSLLCDETTRRKPSLPNQRYTPRQSKGYFTLDHLSKRRPGRTFQNLKRAYRNAMLNRRFCWTSQGHLGLVPMYTREGDEICVFPGLAVPFVVRRRRDACFLLIGVCYVHEVMDGEWMSAKGHELEEVVFV